MYLFGCFISYLIPGVMKNLVMQNEVMNERSLRCAALGGFFSVQQSGHLPNNRNLSSIKLTPKC